MGWNTVDGNRRKFKGKLRKSWADFADENPGTMMGKRIQLARKLQQLNRMIKDEISAC